MIKEDTFHPARGAVVSRVVKEGIRMGKSNIGGAVLKGSVVLKVGMVGDSQIGKTSLMVKYVEGSFE